VIITTGRIRRTLVNKINLLVDSSRSIEASRLAPVKAESIRLRRASGCFGTSRGLSHHSSSTTSPRAGSSSTTLPTPRVWVPQHVARLITLLVIDYITYAARPVASARCAACRVTHRRPLRLAQARRRQLRIRRASGCLSSLRGLSRGPSSITPLPHVRVPRHVARLVADYFNYTARPVASARHAARRAALHSTRRRLLHSRRLVVDYFTYATRPVASARRATCRVTHRRLLHLTQARRRLLRLRCAAGCLGSPRGSSRGLLSTTLTMPRVRVLRHVGQLVALLVVDYATRPVASARRAARRAARRSARRRLLRLAQAPRRLPHLRRASGCFGTLRSLSRDSS
jgi:hypothetical protein